MRDEKQENLDKGKEYLVKYKEYTTCIKCGELVDPNDTHHNIEMCDSCYDYSLSDERD